MVIASSNFALSAGRIARLQALRVSVGSTETSQQAAAGAQMVGIYFSSRDRRRVANAGGNYIGPRFESGLSRKRQ